MYSSLGLIADFADDDHFHVQYEHEMLCISTENIVVRSSEKTKSSCSAFVLCLFLFFFSSLVVLAPLVLFVVGRWSCDLNNAFQNELTRLFCYENGTFNPPFFFP
jgi:hypothetical protein